MTQSTSLALLLVALIVGVGVGFGLRPLLPKLKGAPKEVLNVADTVINDAKKVEDTVGKILLPAPESALIEKVLQAAQTGVHKAQQLFNSGQVTDDQRKQVAFNAAMNLLSLAGIKSSTEVETAVNDAIEDGVFIMKSFSAPQAATGTAAADANTVDATAADPAAGSVSVAPAANTLAVSNPAQAAVVQTVQQEAQKASNQAVQNVIEQFTNAVQNAVQQAPAADTAASTAQTPPQG